MSLNKYLDTKYGKIFVILIKLLIIGYGIDFLCNNSVYNFNEPYIFIGIFGVSGIFINNKYRKEIKLNKWDITIIIILTLCILLGNYEYIGFYEWKTIAGFIKNSFRTISIFLASFIIFKEIFILLTHIDIVNKDKKIDKAWNKKVNRNLFLITFIVIVFVDCFFLFTCSYPGSLSPDSTWQIEQFLTGEYSNHHPFYHTQIIRLFYSLGMLLFNDVNAAIATYSVFQIVLMALTFSYVVSTIYKASINLKLAIIVAIWYLVMPFNIQYSYTMWKDVIFGAVMTLYAVSMFRILKNLGNIKNNYIVMILSAIGICLLRSNGYFIFFFSVLIFIFLFKEKKKLILIFLCILASTYILKHPVLDALNVSQPDTIEALSIPAQQVARVIYEGKALTDEQLELLDNVIDVSKISDYYMEYCSDPIKVLVREKDGQDYIKDHKLEFLKLWIKLGIKYPTAYLRAWIEETKGYWNAGYLYWIWLDEVNGNGFGVFRVVNNLKIKDFYDNYCANIAKPVWCIFISTGLYTWLNIISLWRSKKQGNKEALFVCIPFLMMIISLCIATPVYNEFRYAYSLYCAMPFILLVSSSFFNRNLNN